MNEEVRAALNEWKANLRGQLEAFNKLMNQRPPAESDSQIAWKKAYKQVHQDMWKWKRATERLAMPIKGKRRTHQTPGQKRV